MKKLVVGILAHVDAGKTTLSEGMLFVSGSIGKLGRVDHKNAFLDNNALERERGITIFSKQARMNLPQTEITLLDTPGHVDFSAEMERTLQVLDYAILVISGTDGVQSHTETLWRLLRRYEIPTFLFINKMDLAGADKSVLIHDLQTRLSSRCVDFSATDDAARCEQISLCDEALLEEYLENGKISASSLAAAVAQRRVYPCFFGSALKLEGVEELLGGLDEIMIAPKAGAALGARVYKISRDPQGARLTWLKVTGGELRVKEPLCGKDGADEWEEKVDQIRLYSGEKYQTADAVPAGTVCAVTGLSRTFPGEGLGAERETTLPSLEPVLTYRILLPPEVNLPETMKKLRQLEEEDPQLHILWDERLQEIQVSLMGEVQLEILQRLIRDRFGLQVSFDAGRVVYKETIADTVEGVGHYEPLRHYAEVHLVLEPAPRGSGLTFASACSTDDLDLNWQRLVLTHLAEKTHLGVLTGSPVTDMKITLTAGRAHIKHTEGGDFRQATYRAVRQGLRQARSVLLEPFYDFSIELPTNAVGRAMTDIQQRGGVCEPPVQTADAAVLKGYAPVAAMREYPAELASYTRGRGRITLQVRGYEACARQDELVAEIGYDPDADVENSADSVFCSGGAGVLVPWYEVKDHMHLESTLKSKTALQSSNTEPAAKPALHAYRGTAEEDRELQAIYERTYGAVKRKEFIPRKQDVTYDPPVEKPRAARQDNLPEYLLVDGYNIIFAWDELKSLAAESLAFARQSLAEILSNYQGYRKCGVILVFDAYKVHGNPGSVEHFHNIDIVYTKEAETADMYIEKVTYQIGKKYRIRVATSDNLEQLIILGHGAARLSAKAFHAEVAQANTEIDEIVRRYQFRNRKGSTIGEILGRTKR